MALPESNKQYFTYGDYLKWPEDERWELIDGLPYAMTPSPKFRHQDLAGAFYAFFRLAFKGKLCRAAHAPFDVLLPKQGGSLETIDTVVQPDVLVFCDPKKLITGTLRGAPDLVVEVLSPSTVERDWGEKMRLYEKHGVRCYLIVDPWAETVTQRVLDANGQFSTLGIFAQSDKMPIAIFPDLIIDLTEVFIPDPE